MTKAYQDLRRAVYIFIYGPKTVRSIKKAIRYLPKLGCCHKCNNFGWISNEVPAYSSYDGAYLCQECVEINDEETDMAWKEYYSGRL